MATRKYLVGNHLHKKHIQSLLHDELPIFVEYDYLEICEEMMDRLHAQGSKTGDDFDYVMCEMLDDMELDIKERLYGLREDILPYLLRIEEAVMYFKEYVEQLDLLPMPYGIILRKGTPNSVMVLEKKV